MEYPEDRVKAEQADQLGKTRTSLETISELIKAHRTTIHSQNGLATDWYAVAMMLDIADNALWLAERRCQWHIDRLTSNLP
jgi:hypothetical protein